MTDYDVVGGASGIDADTEDMQRTGALISNLGQQLGDFALETHAALVDPNLLSSVVLSPGSFAEFETALLEALDGPAGLTATSLRMTAAGVFMRAKARAYQVTDEALAEWAEDLRQDTQGAAFGLSPGLAVLVGAGYFLATDGAADPQAWLVAHPDLLEEVVGSAPGLLDLLVPGAGFPANVEQASALLALLYDQAAVAPTTDGPRATKAPQNLPDAMFALDSAARHEDQFRIEQVGTGADSVYNVYLPGTKVFDAPWAQGDLVQNLGTNFAGVAGAENAYVASVLAGLRRAGVPHDAPINLMGHSQGGIVAARLAEQMTAPDNPAPYDVRSVVTAGSPVDHIDLPEDVRMVSLVNEYDIVPRLDGDEYDDLSNHTTIVTGQQTGSVTGNHAMTEMYLPMSRDLAASDDPAIRAALDPLADFFPGGGSRTWHFQMHRD